MQALNVVQLLLSKIPYDTSRTNSDDTAPLVVVINVTTEPKVVMITVTEINHDKYSSGRPPRSSLCCALILAYYYLL